MNIRLAQLKLFNVWSYDASKPGEKPPASGAKLGKPRIVDNICLSVSIYFKTHFSGMFFPYLPISTNDVT